MSENVFEKLEKLKKAQLIEFAQKAGVEAGDQNTKAEIIEMIKAEAEAKAKKKAKKAEPKKEEPKPAKKEEPKEAPKAEGKPARETKKSARAEKIKEDMEARIVKNRASKKFLNDGAEVFTQKAETKYAGEVKNVDPSLQKLIYAAQTNSYLTGRLSAVRRSSPVGLCAVVFFGEEPTYQVLIPFDKFSDITDEELEKRHLNKNMYLERRIGSEIDFVPEDFDTDDDGVYYFTGNRVLAMKLAMKEYWFAKDRETGDLMFGVGSRMEARVVGKYPRAGIRIEIYGAETLVPITQLFHTHTSPDLSQIKEDVGDTMTVAITKLDRREDPLHVEFSASRKACMEDPRLKAFERIQVGDSIHGVISNVYQPEDLKKSRIFVKLDGGGEAMCNRFDHEVLNVGDKVTCFIGNKYVSEEGEPRIECLIRHVWK